jgi:hypothetical protein
LLLAAEGPWLQQQQALHDMNRGEWPGGNADDDTALLLVQL